MFLYFSRDTVESIRQMTVKCFRAQITAGLLNKCENMDWLESTGRDFSTCSPTCISLRLICLCFYLPGQWLCPVKMMCSANCRILKNARNATAFPVSSFKPPRIRHTYTHSWYSGKHIHQHLKCYHAFQTIWTTSQMWVDSNIRDDRQYYFILFI